MASVAQAQNYTPSDFSHYRDVISAAAAVRILERDPSANQVSEDAVVQQCREDITSHLRYLGEAVAATSPALFRHYTEWATSVSQSKNISPDHLRACYSSIAEVLQESGTTGDVAIAVGYLNDALPLIDKSDGTTPSHLTSAHEVAPQLLEHLLACRRQDALGLVDAAAAAGTSILDIYLRIFQPVLRELGRLWQHNQITVAQEHYSSAAIQLMMGRLADKIFATDRIGKTIISACVGDELHEIGLRMVADAMEVSGWDTHFLGANVPAPDLVRTAKQVRTDVIALSVTLTSNLSRLHDIVCQIRAEPALDTVKIVVGGYPFIVQPDLWDKVGADGCARDAEHAIMVCSNLVGL